MDQLLKEVCEASAQSFPAVGIGTDVRIDSKELAGAALVRDDSVVHLSAFRKTTADRGPNRGTRRRTEE